MTVKIFKNILTLILFTIPVIILLNSDNEYKDRAMIEDDPQYCLLVKRDVLKDQCFRLYHKLKIPKCLNAGHPRLVKDCLKNLNNVRTKDKIGYLNSLLFLIELVLLWMITRSLLGEFYWSKLNRWGETPLIGKLITFYRNNQEYDSSFVIRLLLYICSTLFVLLASYILRHYL